MTYLFFLLTMVSIMYVVSVIMDSPVAPFYFVAGIIVMVGMAVCNEIIKIHEREKEEELDDNDEKINDYYE